MEPKIAKEEPLKAEIKHFLECVENGSKPLVTCEDALRTLKLAIEIEKEHIIK
jgi:UDP-N-acetylglucosamine 3-dehydrogenase